MTLALNNLQSFDMPLNKETKPKTRPSDKLLKSVDQFTFLGGNISSTESYVCKSLEKVRYTIDN